MIHWILFLGNLLLCLAVLLTPLRFLTRTNRRRHRIALLFVFVAFAGICAWFGWHTESSVTNPFLWLNSALLLYILFGFTDSIPKKLLVFLSSIALNMAAGMICLPIERMVYPASTEAYYAIMLPCNVLAYLLIVTLFSALIKANPTNLHVPNASVWLIIYLAGQCIVYACLFTSKITTGLTDRWAHTAYPTDKVHTVIWVLFLVISLFGDVAVYLFIAQTEKNQREQNRLSILTLQQQLGAETASAMQEEHNRAVALVQKLQTQVSAYRRENDELPPAQISALFQALSAELLPQTLYTKNAFVNAVLYTELKDLELPKAEILIRLPEEVENFPKYDLCRVLSNLLRNARRALEKTAVDQRFLFVECFQADGYLFIKTVNPCVSEAESGAQRKGLGLGICRDIAKAHGGTFSCRCDENTFQVLFTARLKEESACNSL